MREVGGPSHASTEQLSALLDDRAEAGERAFLDEHLTRCRACAGELDGLRAVRDMLRALPVHLPPRSFTIPVPAAERRAARRFGRLVPLTRALGGLAAVLCVVLFSLDAMGTVSEMTVPASDTAKTMQTSAPARPGAAAAPAAESAPAAPAAAPAPDVAARPAAQQPVGAAQPAPARVTPDSTITAFVATQPAIVPTGAPAQPEARAAAPVPTDVARQTRAAVSPGLTPLRAASLGLAVLAAVLLIGSFVLARFRTTGLDGLGNGRLR